MRALFEHHRARNWLALHFDRQLDPADERRLRAHLARCDRCRAMHAAHSAAEQRSGNATETRRRRLEAGLFGEAPGKRATRSEPARQPAWLPWRPLALIAAAAVAAIVVIGPREQPAEQAGFRAKGTANNASSADSRVSISAYQRRSGSIAPLKSDASGALRLEAGPDTGGLAFAYVNESTEGFDRLLLFALDEKLRLYWYFPARSDGQLPARGLPIRQGTVELAEEVAYRYPNKRLRVFGLFYRDDRLSPGQVERIAGRIASEDKALADLQRFPLPRDSGPVGQHVIRIRVGVR